MEIRDFLLERFFAEHEFAIPHHLSASDCEALTVADVLQLAGEPTDTLLDLGLGYTESRGDPLLRSAIAEFYPGCAAEQVLVTNAPEEAIFLAMHGILEPGDRVIVQTPCYQSLGEIARSIGCTVTPWPLVEPDRDRARWQLDLDTLERQLPGARLLVLNAPHNPTGHQPSRAAHRRVLELARTHGVRVFFDEMYRGLEPDPDAALPPAASEDERALSLWGVSKTFGLPGLRIGWLVCRDRDLLDRIGRLKDYTTICSSAPGELLARLALGCAERIAADNRARIAHNRDRVDAFMADHGEVLSWTAPQAGPVALARVHGESASSLCERSRAGADVLLVPTRVFDMEDRYVRLGLGRAGFGDALAVFDHWLRTSRQVGDYRS